MKQPTLKTLIASALLALPGLAAFAATATTDTYFKEQVQTGTTAKVAVAKLEKTYGPENITVGGIPFQAITPKSLRGTITPIAVRIFGPKKQVKGSVDVMLCPLPEQRNKTGLDFEQFNTAWTQQTLFIEKQDYDAAIAKHCSGATMKPLKEIEPATWTRISGLETADQAACYYRDTTADNKVRTVSFAKDVVNGVNVYLRAVTLQQQSICVPKSANKN